MFSRKSPVLPRIDNSPPILFVDNILHSTKLVNDIRRQREVAKQNKELLKRIDRINRTKGFLGVNYDYKPKLYLNWEAREQEAKRIHQANLQLLERILDVSPEIIASNQEKSYRSFDKYRKICSKRSKPRMLTRRKAKDMTGYHSLVMECCERNDRKLGSLKINLFKNNVTKYLMDEGIRFIEGQIYRIYKDQYVVIRAHVSISETKEEQRRQLIENVERGSLLRAIINEQPALLLTLTTFQRLANCQVLGTVDPSGEQLLDLLNYYGTTWGRTLEPLCFRIKIKVQT
ncbi:uncharacterized protein LOC131695780 [Topomyia yanbarensis]|uniref:uncharacterized protein LOC131695780 n=1 Tax=Topomyia yanbarensis TaxID=2498891 RepID=UPI00273AEF9D|nr:uncharacterized protein LOC131695780 [Topomyia yanbarensis]